MAARSRLMEFVVSVPPWTKAQQIYNSSNHQKECALTLCTTSIMSSTLFGGNAQNIDRIPQHTIPLLLCDGCRRQLKRIRDDNRPSMMCGVLSKLYHFRENEK